MTHRYMYMPYTTSGHKTVCPTVCHMSNVRYFTMISIYRSWFQHVYNKLFVVKIAPHLWPETFNEILCLNLRWEVVEALECQI